MAALAIQNLHEMITESVIDKMPTFSTMHDAANDDQKVNILLVDDDDVAVEWVVRCMNKLNVNFNVEVADDGQSALNLLQEKHKNNDSDKPHFVLLDLNMPGMNGFEFLEKMNANPDLASTVVFVLTTSNANSDRARAFNEGVAGYLLKDATSMFNWLFSLLPKHTKMTNLLSHSLRINAEDGIH
jgi:CheY-like chemotaxis protein